MLTKEYWNDRVLKYGHTGHAEPFLYCFDQEARKFAIRELLNTITFTRKENALDFGCGSGDFLDLLKEFRQSVAYDVSEKVIEKARSKYARKALVFTDAKENISSKAPYDLILTVTVLQGLKKEELETELSLLSNALSDDGYMICMEFFTTEELNYTFKENRLTKNVWEDILKKNDLMIVAQHPFYNPILAPSNSWKKYNKDLILKGLKIFKKIRLIRSVFSLRAKQIIYRKRDVLAGENSIFKIYIIQKTVHADQTS